MRNSEKWAALSVLVVSYACATGVVLDEGDYNLLNGTADPGMGGSEVGAGGGASGDGQGGSGPAPSNGGTTGQPGSGGTGAAPGQGGTGAAMGGSAGAMAQGGAAGTGQGGGNGAGGTGTIEPTGECADPTGMQILYTNSSQANQIGMTLQVQQTPPGTFPLSDLTIRYWFDDDDLPTFVGEVDFATQGTNAPPLGLSFTFGEALGVNYAEMHFTSTNPLGAGIDTINVRIHAMPFATLTLTNDPSFLAAATAPTLNENITAYVGTDHVFGCEPPAP